MNCTISPVNKNLSACLMTKQWLVEFGRDGVVQVGEAVGEAVIHIKSMGKMHSAMFYLNNFAFIRATYMILVSLYR